MFCEMLYRYMRRGMVGSDGGENVDLYLPGSTDIKNSVRYDYEDLHRCFISVWISKTAAILPIYRGFIQDHWNDVTVKFR